MRIWIRLFANLKKYAPGGDSNFNLELGSGATVGRLLESLDVPAPVKAVILVNGRHAKEETQLADGDTVILFPPMAGG
ncbi:MAG: MoaD/ThiS family protein [Desulfobacteraceae bacterium]|nr:MAG: MoaD/ThiS family protein [Desulfobacteraceae bacterium]